MSATVQRRDIFDPSTSGDSIAHWEGDTLVADTIGFHSTRGVTSIPGGGYRTEKSHLVERYKLIQNGNVLSVTFTWTDPTVFAAPQTYEFRYYRLPAGYEARAALPCERLPGATNSALTASTGTPRRTCRRS